MTVMADLYKRLGLISVHIQIDLETLDDGHQRAKCTRLESPPAQGYETTHVMLHANRFGESQPTVALGAFLYWKPDTLNEQAQSKVERQIPKYLEGLLKADEALRQAVSAQLGGDGWYVGSLLLK